MIGHDCFLLLEIGRGLALGGFSAIGQMGRFSADRLTGLPNRQNRNSVLPLFGFSRGPRAKMSNLILMPEGMIDVIGRHPESREYRV